MQSQNDTDVLQVKRRSSGELIAVGLPWNSGIVFQEYWIKGIPHYAVANVSTEVATVAVAEWNGLVGRHLMGPWMISPKTVQCYDIQTVQAHYSGPLVAISLNENPVFGLLKSPQPPPEPIDWDRLDGILTTYGLNGAGDRYANIQCLQEKLGFDAGQVIPLLFQIPGRAGSISFKMLPQSHHLPPAVVVGATSKTLAVERGVDSYIISARETRESSFDEIRLEVELPGVTGETMAALWGHVAYPGGSGFSFGRGLIVRADE